MKHLLWIYCLLALVVRGAVPGTTEVSTPVAPSQTNSNYGATDTRWGVGGYGTWATNLSQLTDVNWLPPGRKQGGMIDAVNGFPWQLSTNLTTWFPNRTTYPVELFGVFPGGQENATANTTGLRNAMTYIKGIGGGTLLFTFGDYYINGTITNLATVHVRGAPTTYSEGISAVPGNPFYMRESATRVTAADNMNAPMWMVNDPTGPMRDNGASENLPDGSTAHAYYTDVSIEDMVFIGRQANQTRHDSDGVWILDAWNVTFSRCVIEDFKGVGLYLRNSNVLRIHDNCILGTEKSCCSMYYCQDTEMNNNFFGGSTATVVLMKAVSATLHKGNLWYNNGTAFGGDTSIPVGPARVTESYDTTTLTIPAATPHIYETGEQVNVFSSLTNNTATLTAAVTGYSNPYTLTVSGGSLGYSMSAGDSFYVGQDRFVVNSASSGPTYRVYGFGPTSTLGFSTVRAVPLPAGLSENNIYYVIKDSATTLRLATTWSNSLAIPPVAITSITPGGNPITVDQGGLSGLSLVNACYDNTFTGNRFDQNRYAGVNIQYGFNNLFTGNIIFWNGWFGPQQQAGIEVTGGSRDNSFTANQFSRLTGVPQYQYQTFGIISNGKRNVSMGNVYDAIPTTVAIMQNGASPDTVLDGQTVSLRARKMSFGRNATDNAPYSWYAHLQGEPDSTGATLIGAQWVSQSIYDVTGVSYGNILAQETFNSTNLASVNLRLSRNLVSGTGGSRDNVGLQLLRQTTTPGHANLLIGDTVPNLAGIGYGIYQSDAETNQLAGPLRIVSDKFSLGPGAGLGPLYGMSIRVSPPGDAAHQQNTAINVLHEVVDDPNATGTSSANVLQLQQRWNVATTRGSAITVLTPTPQPANANTYSHLNLNSLEGLTGFHQHLLVNNGTPPGLNAFIYSNDTNYSYFAGGIKFTTTNSPVALGGSPLYIASTVGPYIRWGDQNPNGIFTANSGSMVLSSTGGDGTTGYLKTAGTDANGWKPINTDVNSYLECALTADQIISTAEITAPITGLTFGPKGAGLSFAANTITCNQSGTVSVTIQAQLLNLINNNVVNVWLVTNGVPVQWSAARWAASAANEENVLVMHKMMTVTPGATIQVHAVSSSVNGAQLDNTAATASIPISPALLLTARLIN